MLDFDFRKMVNKYKGKELTKRVRIFTGYRCNIKCEFCFYKGMKDEISESEILNRIWKQMDIAKQCGIKNIDLSGGETTCMPFWEILLKFSSKCFDKVAVISNGYKLSNADFFESSAKMGLNEVLFSFHGTKKTHDLITGIKGSYEKITKAIENANILDIPLRINIVVSKRNYKEMPELAKIINNFNPIAVNFLPFRVENTAEKINSVRLTESIPYIQRAIDILKSTVIKIRYVPFCVVNDQYKKYVCGYKQKMFDEYEWSEYAFRKLELIRKNEDPKKECYPEIKNPSAWNLESSATYKTLSSVCGFKKDCLHCRNLLICDGIWKSYRNIWGIKEFKSEKSSMKIRDINHYVYT